MRKDRESGKGDNGQERRGWKNEVVGTGVKKKGRGKNTRPEGSLNSGVSPRNSTEESRFAVVSFRIPMVATLLLT